MDTSRGWGRGGRNSGDGNKRDQVGVRERALRDSQNLEVSLRWDKNRAMETPRNPRGRHYLRLSKQWGNQILNKPCAVTSQDFQWGLRHQTTHKHFYLPTRYAGVRTGQKRQDIPETKARTKHNWGKATEMVPSDTLLDSYRWLSSFISCFTQKLMKADPQPNTRRSSRESCEDREEGLQHTTRKPTEPNNLGSQRLTETEPTTKEPTWGQPRPSVCNGVTWSSYEISSESRGCL